MPQRVALYARYSTDLQRDASVEDQLNLCRKRAEREGWAVVESYSDRAVSGASLLRPGIQAPMEDAGRRRFDITSCSPRPWTASRVTRKTLPACASGSASPTLRS